MVVAFGGCSSSTNNNNGNGSGGHPDAATGSSSGGMSSSGGSSGGTGDSGHVDSGHHEGGGGGDAGGSCPDNAAFTPQAYMAPTAHRGACSASEITAFITACGDNGSATTCNDWQNMFSADGGTNCFNCIFDPNNTGGTWTDQHMFFTANYGACLALVDSTHGPTCAKAFDTAIDCESFQCDSCNTATEYQTCANGVDSAICMTQSAAEMTACQAELAADAGTGTMCFPGNGMTANPDLNFILGLICGTGEGGSPPPDGGGPAHDGGGTPPDGGGTPPDSGHD
jgi:hypothetical protein